MMNKKTRNAIIRLNAYPEKYIYTTWDRIKTAVWNFILPPHIRFTFETKEQELLGEEPPISKMETT